MEKYSIFFILSLDIFLYLHDIYYDILCNVV